MLLLVILVLFDGEITATRTIVMASNMFFAMANHFYKLISSQKLFSMLKISLPLMIGSKPSPEDANEHLKKQLLNLKTLPWQPNSSGVATRPLIPATPTSVASFNTKYDYYPICTVHPPVLL